MLPSSADRPAEATNSSLLKIWANAIMRSSERPSPLRAFSRNRSNVAFCVEILRYLPSRVTLTGALSVDLTSVEPCDFRHDVLELAARQLDFDIMHCFHGLLETRVRLSVPIVEEAPYPSAETVHC